MAAGEERALRFRLGPADLAHLDASLNGIVEACEYELLIGASNDVPLRGTFAIEGSSTFAGCRTSVPEFAFV